MREGVNILWGALDTAGAREVLSGRTTSDLVRVAGELVNDPITLQVDLSPPGAGTEEHRLPLLLIIVFIFILV